MRKIVSIMAVVTALMAMATAPAGAITGNYVEDFEHPFVGLVVFYDADGEFSHRCSASLISPTVLLTPGHCAADAHLFPAGRWRKLRSGDATRSPIRLPGSLRHWNSRYALRDIRRALQSRLRRLRQFPEYGRRGPGHARSGNHARRMR
ncbi:MAG TPA: hypothetical protein PKA95_11850 [Thermomicrobiales bacterium]|nr:hypothetical protein [Thermomicrobiales bacterium]